MAIVGFAILFSGVINGYFAAAGTSAILTFVLPVTIAAPMSAVPARLEGWALAAGAGILAHMLLWPARPRAALRGDAARACRALADLADPDLPRERSAAAAREAVADLHSRFLETPHRPTGPTGPTAALAALVDELDWLLSFLVPRAGSLELCRDENAEAMAATASVLRAAAARLDGREEQPDLQRLDEAREAVAQALVRQDPRVAEHARRGGTPCRTGPGVPSPRELVFRPAGRGLRASRERCPDARIRRPRRCGV